MPRTTTLLPSRIPYGRIAPRVLGLIAIGMGVGLVVIAAALLLSSMQARSAQEQAGRQAQAQAEVLQQGLQRMQQALASPTVAERIRAGADREALLEALREGGIRSVLHLVIAEDPVELTDLSQLPGGGFAALDMLVQAGASGRAPAQAHFAATPDEYLALAQRLEDGQAPTVVLWVGLPMAALSNLMQLPDGVDGLALSQRGGGSTVTIHGLGQPVSPSAQRIPVPGTRLEVTWVRAIFINPMGTGQLGGLLGAGLLFLLLGGLMLRRASQPVVEKDEASDEAGLDDDTPTSIHPVPAPRPAQPAPTAPIDHASDEGSMPTGSVPETEDEDLGPMLGDPDESTGEPEPDRGPGGSDEAGAVQHGSDEAGIEDEDDNGLTADGEARRESVPDLALDASELGSFLGGGARSEPSSEDEAVDLGKLGAPEEDVDDVASADTADDFDSADAPGLALEVEDEDEQAAMGEMLRSLMGEDAPAAPAPAPASAPAAAAAPSAEPASSGTGTRLPEASIFRAYDIRGVVGDTLDEDVAEAIGRAIGSEARDRNLGRIAVARDGRLSGAQMLAALSRGLASTGLEVIDVGAVPTPVLYYAAQEVGGGSGVMVTGSHNPPDYNGFKIVLGGETLAGEAIAALRTRLVEGRLVSGEGQVGEARVNDRYVERIANDIQLEKPLKLVMDCGNGIAGAIAPRLLSAIGADVIPLYAEVDGSFPNHHPDPGDPATLEDLRLCVRNFEADLGIAFDGDGDRLGVVGPDGEIIYPDRLMMLFARDVLSRNAGAEIIYDVKCSSLLAGEIENAGGVPVMARTGHSFIKAELKQRNAPLAGEMSGHFFFGERWFGFDDGLYSAARLLEILGADTRATGQVFASLPKAESTPELKVQMKEGEPHAFVEAFRADASFDGATINAVDGVRADFEDGFGLVRASNTTPVLVLRFEGTNKDALARIQRAFREAMLKVNPALKLPF